VSLPVQVAAFCLVNIGHPLPNPPPPYLFALPATTIALSSVHVQPHIAGSFHRQLEARLAKKAASRGGIIHSHASNSTGHTATQNLLRVLCSAPASANVAVHAPQQEAYCLPILAGLGNTAVPCCLASYPPPPPGLITPLVVATL
jgi:hypothetical protein